MDDQMRQPTFNEYPDEADYDKTDNEAIEDAPAEDISEPLPSDETPSPEVSLGDDGEVNFSEEFFGEMPSDEPDDEAARNYYTDEELSEIPFEQWDVNRLQGDIRRYVPIYQEQMRRRHAQQQVMENTRLPSMMREPPEYTPKELAEDAQKLACEKLGLDDPEDFDGYEGEHQAALDMARQELMQRRQIERASYHRGAAEWGELQKFNAELAGRPDFPDFNRWFMGKLNAKGLTRHDVDNAFMEYASKNNWDFSSVRGVIGNWYQEYQRERGMMKKVRLRGRTTRPPVLESTRGSSYEGRRNVNMSDFGEMDMDRQASALMKMGIV